MGVFYSFKPKLTKTQIDEFLKEEKIQFESYKEDHRMVVQLKCLQDIDYLLFYYEDTENIVAHSSHDFPALTILKKLKDRFKLNVESDNDEFTV
jgi:hypothetical protein